MKVFEAHRELLTIGEEITAKKVRNFLLGIETDDSKTLLEIYKHHIEEIKELLGKEYAPGTLKRFKVALSSLEAFLQHKKLADISLKDVNHKFITDYEFVLKTVRNVEHNTAMGILKKLKKITRICVANTGSKKIRSLTSG